MCFVGVCRCVGGGGGSADFGPGSRPGEERAQVQVVAVTVPSGSWRVAVIGVLIWGWVVDSPMVPGSSWLVTATVRLWRVVWLPAVVSIVTW